MHSLNLQKQTLLKTSTLSNQSLGYFFDKKKQFILIAQPKGIHIYNTNSQKFQQQLKLTSLPNNNLSTQISCVTVSDDLFFFAYGMHIGAAGYNAKVVFNFDTFMAADRIDRIHVVGYRLWVITGNILNQFMMAGSQLANKLSRKAQSTSNKVQDIHSHMFQSAINCSYLVQDEFSKHFLILLTANNQIICYEDKQICTYKTNSPPITIIRYPNSKQNRYLVGTMSGQMLQLEITRKHIKQIWKISGEQSKGKINVLIQIKNQAIILARDQAIQIWGQDKTMLAQEQYDQKYVCGLYIMQKQLLIVGSTNGTVTQMRDYAKMMKDYQQRNQAKIKQNIQKQIASLQLQYQTLKTKALAQKTKPTSSSNISAEASLSMDYQNKCTCLEIKSQSKIIKIIAKGRFQIIKCSKLAFSHKQPTQNTYIIQQQQTTKFSKTLIKFKQQFNKNNKIKLIIYVQKQKKLYGITRIVDIKYLCYYQKISKNNLINYNQLRITGQFKYFQMNMYINMVFWDFGTAQNGDGFNQVYFQSIITGQKLVVRYKNGECLIQSGDPAPLILIKHFLLQKSQQKQLNFNFSTQISAPAVKNLVLEIQKTLRPMQNIKKQAELIPGLLQIQNDQSLSADLKDIISRSQQINKKHKETQRDYQSLLASLRNVYRAYKKLKQHQVSQFQLDNFNRLLLRFDAQKVIAMILA